MSNSQHGNIYLTFIILISLISSLSTLSFLYFYQTLQLQKDELLVSKNNQNEQEEVINSIQQPDKYIPGVDCYGIKEQICTKTAGTFYTNTFNQNISLIDLALKSDFPQIPWDSVISDNTNCPNSVQQLTRLTSTGTTLSVGSLVWGETCVLTSIASGVDLTSKHNLEISEPTQITNISPGAYQLLASTGYIQFNGDLVTAKDLIIIAAGDINIPNLTALTSQRITIISASGVITISRVSGSPQLRLISKLGHFLQGSYELQSSPLLPPLITNQLLLKTRKAN